MNELILVFLVGFVCVVVPINLLIILSVVGVMLADTRLVPQEFIYYGRFVPIGILASRALLFLFTKGSAKKIGFSMVKSWIPFLLFASVSIIYSLEPWMSAQRVLSAWLVMIGFGIGIPAFLNRIKNLQQLMLLISIFMGGAILYSYHAMPSEQYALAGAQEYERFYGIFRNPNTMGLLAMQAIFPVMYLWKKEKKGVIKQILSVLLVLMGGAIIISGSRASALGFLIGVMVFLWGSSKIRHKALSTLFMVILLLASVYLMVGYFFPEYTEGIFRSGTAGRTEIVKHEWELVQEYPFLGAGFGGSDGLYMRDAWKLRMQGIYVAGSHNSYMRLLVELGFTGLLLFFYAFLALTRQSIKYLRHFEDSELGIILLSVIAASFVNAIFESWLFSFGSSSTIPFWLFLAILYYLIDQTKAGVKKAGRNPSINNSATFIARRITHGYRIKQKIMFNNSPRIALVTNVFAHYRRPCFSQLSKVLQDKITFFFLSKDMPHRDYIFSKEEPSFSAIWLRGYRWHLYPYDDRHINDIRPVINKNNDIIIMGGWDEPTYLFTWLMGNIMKKRVLFWIESTAYESSRTGIKELYKKLLLKHAAGCIVPGKRSFEYCSQLGMDKDRIFIAPNAADREYFRGNADSLLPNKHTIKNEMNLSGPVILFVGRLVEKHKQVSTLINAFADLNRRGNTISLMLAGDGPDREKYEELVKKKNIRGVHFTGKLNHKQLCRIYASADILALPSCWEPWGFVLNEGMEFGLPLVVSEAVGAGPDLVREGENGFVFPVGDVEALTAKLELLVKDESLRKRMGEKSKKIIQDFSPENWAAGVVHAIKTVTGEK